MKNIINSCFGQKDSAYADYLQLFLDEADHYKVIYKVNTLLDPKEIEFFKYLIQSYESAKEMPTRELFELAYPETDGQFDNCKVIPLSSLRGYIFNLIDLRLNGYISSEIAGLNSRIKTEGLTEDIKRRLDELDSLSNRNKGVDVDVDFLGRSTYTAMKQRPKGMKTGIKAIDEKIGGMTEGTVTTIAGFTSHFKTTFALNIAYLNSYYQGYNIVYFTLETPKQDMYWNLLSMHSYDTKFSKYNYIEHERIRRGELTPDEEQYLFDVIEADLKNEGAGQIIFLDESDFKTFSFGEITRTLEKIDDLVQGGIKAVIVDYVQLCKFSGTGFTYDANSQINSYTVFFRRLAQSFRTLIDNQGHKQVKQLVMILLAQLNREGWKKANRNEGAYDITALADANELERGSFRVFTIYTNEDMKARGSAQVQILKNRSGQTMYEPAQISVIPAAYVVTDEEIGANSSFGADGQASMEAAFAGLDESDLSAFGL